MTALVRPLDVRHLQARVIPIRSLSLPPLLLCTAGCWSGQWAKESADAQVYPLLESVAAGVTGQPKTFHLERPVDTLRQRLLTEHVEVQLSLLDALDVAAENSREFQRQKEQLYLAALNLTRNLHDFEVQFGGGASAEVSGVADDSADVAISDDLGASVNSTAGTRVVASFVNTFLRSVVNGEGFDGSSILNLTLTQPLLRGAGSRIVREPLTQAERDLVYQMRAFERFRAEFAVDVVSDYLAILQQMRDLQNVEANYFSVLQSRIETEENFAAGRRTINDLGREQQSELSAKSRLVQAENRLQSLLDSFKITLGLPTTATIQLVPEELDRIAARGVKPVALEADPLIEVALQRRFDHRTAIDEVEDAGRRIYVAEDALQMALDFTAALNVPAEDGKGLNLDWSRVNWAAGFSLDLALDKLVERNAYRAALIAFDAAVRAREASADQIAGAVRNAVRDIRSAFDTYNIEVEALHVAEQRVESTTELYQAGRTTALEVLDAKDSLLASRLSVTAAIVDYAIARLQLLRDVEGLVLEPHGLRFDPALPLPKPEAAEE